MKPIRRALSFLGAAALAASASAQFNHGPPASTRPSPPPLALSNLWAGHTADVAPQSGFAGTSTVSLSNGVARFRYSGPDGVLEYQWRASQSAHDGLFGLLTLDAQMAGDTPVTLPGNLPDGDYDWLIGIYDAAGDGHRVPLQGVDDGTLRIRLGALRLANAGAAVTFTAETNRLALDPAAWYGQHLNNSNSVVDFGGARTDGSVWLHREGNLWILKTWPRERNFTLDLDLARFAQPAKVQCVGGTASEAIPVPTGSRWRLPLNGATEYRWTNAID